MKSIPPGVELEIVWFDDHMIELQIIASNNRMTGKTAFYAGFDSPKDFASCIAGFPNFSSDIREFEFGGIDLRGYGGAKFQFQCKDQLGHIVLTLTIMENSLRFHEKIESVMQIEPAAVDAFVGQLSRMSVLVGERAFLPAAI